MGRRYIARFESVAVTVAQDFFEIAAPTTGIIRVLEWAVGQTSDVGDAEEEILLINEVRGDGTVTSGTGGVTVIPQAIDNGAPGSTATVESNNTTKMAVGTGTLDALQTYHWNVRMSCEKIYTPETYPIISPGDRWTLELVAAPADELTCSGYVIYEQIGG